MIMRRAIRFGKKLGLSTPFLPKVAELVIETMGGHYTELKAQKDLILKAVAHEEERFERTLDQGLERAEKIISELKRKSEKLIPGPEAFFLHDTYGFPVEMLEDIAREHGMSVDRPGFAREMEKQRETLKADRSPSRLWGSTEKLKSAMSSWHQPSKTDAVRGLREA
jgi:alanyl-tRNA synthetase